MMLSLHVAFKGILAGPIKMIEAELKSWLMLSSEYSLKHTCSRWEFKEVFQREPYKAERCLN